MPDNQNSDGIIRGLPVCLDMLRRFLADVEDMEAARWLANNESIVSEFLNSKIEMLDEMERYKLYSVLHGFFGTQFSETIQNRLKHETNNKCREMLRLVASIHEVER